MSEEEKEVEEQPEEEEKIEEEKPEEEKDQNEDKENVEQEQENLEENKEENLVENINNEIKPEEVIEKKAENQNEEIEKENGNINLAEEEKNNEEIKENINIEEKNDEKEPKLMNNNEITNISKINHQIEKDDDLLNKELNVLNIKNQKIGNIIRPNDISFSKQGFFEEINDVNNHLHNYNNHYVNQNLNSNFNYNNFSNNYNFNNNLNNNYLPKKSTKQLLSEINNDMDILSNNLQPIFSNYEIKQRIEMEKNKNKYNYSLYNNNGNNNGYYNNDDEFDMQNYEIKKLIQKANNSLLNSNNGRYGRYNYRKNDMNDFYMKENGGNYYNADNNSEINMNANDDENGYIRNISLEKNINKNRIRKMDNIYENTDEYRKEPIIYYQKETFPIKNSYMNENLGLPQTSQKIDYLRSKNSLVFSSDKIPFKSIKSGNMNRSIDLLFSQQK